MRSQLPTSLVFLLFGFTSYAVNIPFTVRTNPFPSHLHARDANTSTSTASSSAAIAPVHNTKNAEYIANITLGGRLIPVLLDTGSSDLWVTGDVPNTKDTGKSVSLSYAVGNAAGDINTADLTFNGYTVPDQAYLLVKNTSSFSLDIKAQGFEGLIGLGPNSGSSVRDEIDNDSGDSVLTRIFSQNTTSQNFLTLLLDRHGDPGSNITGQISLSEVIPGYENITNMPKLSVDKVHKLTDADQHWQTVTDSNGVIGPDGQPIKVKSIVPHADDDQLVVVFDSGYTLPQVPRAMSDAIYGRVQGAVYNEKSAVWTVPCDQLINLSFMFGGVEIPIHPLDVSSSDFGMIDATGNPVCVGAFQPITTAFSLLGEYDIILGMGFLRNAYSLFDYGDWVEDSSVDRNDPYIQLLPITNKQAAHNDFVQVRMNGVDVSGDSSHQLLPASQQQSSPLSPGEKKKQYEEKVLSRWPYILLGCLIFVIALIGIITWRCCVARKRRIAAKAQKAAQMGIAPGGSKGAYTTVDMNGSQVHLKPLSSPGGPNSDGQHYDYETDPYAYSPRKTEV
ncbi:acid protease [Abortiporus biennis]|nr:acid protease [Abortiporus biennis]